MKKINFLFIILGLITILILSGCRNNEEPIQQDLRVPVRINAVEYVKMAKAIHTYGRVSSTKEMKLSFKIGGIIQKIFVDEGQSVSRNQLLAQLNLAEIDSQVSQAKSGFEKAQRDLERIENLYKEKAVTLEQYQNVQTAFQIAQSRLKAAEFNFTHSKIRAPSRGRILKRLVEENELIGAGMPVFFFATTEKDWIVRVGISDSDLVRVKTGDPATVTFDAYPGEEFPAEISQIVESADAHTGTYELELKVETGKKRLVSGFVADVIITPTEKQDYSIIPVEALIEAEGQRGYVFTVDAGSQRAKRIPVTIGFLFDDKVAIISGLENIPMIVTDGAPYLNEGSEIRILNGKSNIDQDNPPPKE